MATALLVLHILVCVLLVLAVMIQGGENVDISAAFGGVSQAAFGPRGAVSTLAKITWALAFIFAATSITLSVWATRHAGRSLLETPGKAAPATPAPATPAPAKK
ncbi:MAG: preprotein translocase subunit SecG [Terriglobia bacterium]